MKTITEMRKLFESATSGPWKATPTKKDVCGSCAGCRNSTDCLEQEIYCPAQVVGCFTVDAGDYMGLNDANANFIAAARTEWPLAVEWMEKARAALEDEKVYAETAEALLAELEK